MLILTRQTNEVVEIWDGDVRLGQVTVVRADKGRVRLGFSAPPHIVFVRPDARDQAPRRPEPVPT